MRRAFILLVVFLFTASILPNNVSAQISKTSLTTVESQAMQEKITELTKLVQLLQAKSVSSRATSSAESSASLTSVKKDEHILGDINAPVKVVVYSDFDCPFCNKFHSTLHELLPKTFTGNKVVWIQRHLPITQLHPGAEKVALASECVAKYEGNEAFWKFSDAYYKARSKSLTTKSSDLLNDVLNDTKLNKRSIKKCIKNKELVSAVTDDIKTAEKFGFQGTPSTAVIAKSGKVTKVSGAVQIDQLAQVITQVLNSQTGTYDPLLREFLPIAKAEASGKITVTQVAPSTIKITGELIPPSNCAKAPDFQFELSLGNGENKIIELNDCKTKTINETVILTPSIAPLFVELILRQVDVLNNVWMNHEQSRIIIKSTNPAVLEITDITNQGEKG